MAVRGLCRRTHAAVKIIAAVPSVRVGYSARIDQLGKEKGNRGNFGDAGRLVRIRSALGW